MLKRKLLALATLGALTFVMDDAAAQYPPYPPQPNPYPQQPQPYPAQPYPPQGQPYPQPFPQQPYPPQGQPFPQQPFPQQPYPQQPYPQQPYPPYPQQPFQPSPWNQQPQPYYPPAPPTTRTEAEMIALYITSGLYGIGTGIWLDALFKIKDPGLAIIMPVAFGAAAPIGVFAVDRYTNLWKRGVPAATSTGLVLGAVEGIAIAGTQWQYTRDDDKDWSFKGQTSITWALATVGGVGGFAFGEWLQPDPRSMLFIGSGAAWGALSGSMFGIAVQGRDADWKDGSSLAGLIGYNVGIAGAGAISVFHTPSLQSQKYMWLGYLAGAAAGALVFPFYLFVDDPVVKRGLMGPSIGGVAGVAVAGALTWNMRDSGDVAKHWAPPVDVAMTPIPPLTPTASNGTSQSSRSLSNMVGPDPRFSTAPPGAMLSASATF